MGKRQLGHDRAFAQVVVQTVDASREHFDKDVSGPRLWCLDVFVLQYIKITKFMDDRCFHFLHLLSARYWQVAGAAARHIRQ